MLSVIGLVAGACLAPLQIVAQTRETMALEGRVLEMTGHTEVPGAFVSLLREDSTVVASDVAYSEWTDNDRHGVHAAYSLSEVPKREEHYILRVKMVGYQTAYINIILSKIGRREYVRTLPPVYLKSESRMLHEVTVTASKVKFYYKGDTLVYNAGALQLTEGSMLDALIRQMPGVKLEKDGRIYHNGKFVESLLLNGKEFFHGDNKVMLENLPAYTVKDIVIYDKYGEKSEWVGRKLESDKMYVMDVRLKREYAIGWLTNLVAGMGTNDRYLAKLFALRFSHHSRIGVYGNFNNLNDNGHPGEDTEWKPDDMLSGRQREMTEGIDFQTEERDGRWKNSGNIELAHTNLDSHSHTERTNFLATGDTYDRVVAGTRNKTLSIKVKDQYETKFKRFNLSVCPMFEYHHIDNKNGTTGLTSDFAKDTLNRALTWAMTRGYDMYIGLNLASTIKPWEHSTDNIELSAKTFYSNKKNDAFKRYRIGYQNSPEQKADQYFKQHPDHDYGQEVRAQYNLPFMIGPGGMELDISYRFRHIEQKRISSLYLLDRMDNTQEELGTLPSVTEYERVMDVANSYDSYFRENSHSVEPFLGWFIPAAHGRLNGQLVVPLTYLHQRLEYRRGLMDTMLTRNTLLTTLHSTYIRWWSQDKVHNVSLQYGLSPQAPLLTDMVNIHDATDPLNVQEGNSGLKNAYTNRLTFNYAHNNKTTQSCLSLSSEYNFTHNALAKGYRYDSKSGVRTYKTYNVDGNWDISVSVYAAGPLDKLKHLTVSSITKCLYRENVDRVNGATCRVRTTKWDEQLKLDYQWNENRIGLKADFTYNHFTSARTDFETINAMEFNFGASALVKLPWQVQLSSDLTLFSRRGFTASQLNTNDLIWNARLTRPFLKGRLLLMLDGYDLLCQLSNISYTMNAQGRSETWVNTIPRYVMLHFVYHWNKNPSKG